MAQTYSPLRLSVLVVGAGPVGLATAWMIANKGHSVRVIERKPELSLQGGDIQVSPNGTLAIRGLGLADILQPVTSSHSFFVARAEEDHALVYSMPIDVVGITPSLMYRRSDLTKSLYRAAINAGVQVLFGKDIKTVDEKNASLQFADGESVSADLVIGADGIVSTVRKLTYPDRDTAPRVLDEVCFQWYTPYSIMSKDPDTLAFWEEGKTHLGLICGDKNFVTYWTNEATQLFYTCGSQRFYKAPAALASWTQTGNVPELQTYFSGYSKPFKTVLEHATSCDQWRVGDSVDGADWVSPSGTVVLLGDAKHAMPPNAAQGLSQGLEDVATLSVFIEAATSKDHLRSLLGSFAAVRQHRVERVIAGARNNAELYGMPPGPDREARDAIWHTFNANEAVAAAFESAAADPEADYNDLNFAKWVQTYDAMAAARESIAKLKVA